MCGVWPANRCLPPMLPLLSCVQSSVYISCVFSYLVIGSSTIQLRR